MVLHPPASQKMVVKNVDQNTARMAKTWIKPFSAGLECSALLSEGVNMAMQLQMPDQLCRQGGKIGAFKEITH